MAKKLISINLDDELIDEVDVIAESVGMSRSAFVNLVLRATCMGETSDASHALLSAALNTVSKVGSKEQKTAVIVE